MKHIFTAAFLRRLAGPLLILLLLASLFPLTHHLAGASPQLEHLGALTLPHGKKIQLLSQQKQPPSDATCRKKNNFPCYSPQEMRTIYGLDPLLNAGYNGAGQTIVVIESFGSPTLAQDLHVFDQGYGLPDPPSLKVYAPLGSVRFDPNNAEHVGWAYEATLDVQWAHAIAPGANIVVLTSPVSETEGVQGLPEFLKLEQYALNHHLGAIISQSWGATENTLFTPAGRALMQRFNRFYQRAAREHVTLLASSGDSGALNPDVNGNNYPFPTVIFPASSPWVLSIGGTSMYADTQGNYIAEAAWNGGLGSATGGGVSQYFAQPPYQRDGLRVPYARELLHGKRGVPDIAYNADPLTGILVYLSFMGKKQAGYYLIGGTSEGTPQWSGIVAIANQRAHRPLGFFNSALYKLGRCENCRNQVFHDVIHGGNHQGKVYGYPARPGWDAVTGWGTPKCATLIPELIRLTK